MPGQNRPESQVSTQIKSLYLWILVLLIAGIVIFGAFIIDASRDYADSYSRRELITRANMAAANISPQLVQALKGNVDDQNSEAYRIIKNRLIAIKQAADDMRFVYLMKNVGNDIIFLVDAEPEDSQDYSPPGQVYPNPSPELWQIFKDGQSFAEGPITDKWGVWVSGHAAIKDPDTGEIEAIIGIDISAQEWQEAVAIVQWGSFSITCLLLALTTLYFFTRWRIDRVDRSRLLTVDELEKTVEELKDTNKELDAFSYSVSHDLRAPLRHIAGFSKIISEECQNDLSVECQEALNRVQTGVKKMDALIEGLLGLSRINRQDMNVSKQDISSIVKDVMEQIQQESGDRHCDFVVQEAMTGMADPHLLRIVFENLLGNAWKYTRNTEKTRIEVGSYREGKNVIYFVADNGVGFDERYSDKLFKSFQRLHRVEEFEGLGIGLSTVSRIIRRHKGRIWAQGSENKGATFYFTLGM